jgi:hypothetical protein
MVVGYLHLMLSTTCPNHPLLGLQLFTLGACVCVCVCVCVCSAVSCAASYFPFT